MNHPVCHFDSLSYSDSINIPLNHSCTIIWTGKNTDFRCRVRTEEAVRSSFPQVIHIGRTNETVSPIEYRLNSGTFLPALRKSPQLLSQPTDYDIQ